MSPFLGDIVAPGAPSRATLFNESNSMDAFGAAGSVGRLDVVGKAKFSEPHKVDRASAITELDGRVLVNASDLSVANITGASQPDYFDHFYTKWKKNLGQILGLFSCITLILSVAGLFLTRRSKEQTAEETAKATELAKQYSKLGGASESNLGDRSDSNDWTNQAMLEEHVLTIRDSD